MADPIDQTIWQWIVAGFAGTLTATAGVIGRLFLGRIDMVEKRTSGAIDDLWLVRNADAKSAGDFRERIIRELSEKPSRSDLSAEIAALERRLSETLRSLLHRQQPGD